MFQSSNPALANDDAFQEFYGDRIAARPDTVTLQGVVNKTAILVGLAIGAGVFGYWGSEARKRYFHSDFWLQKARAAPP